MASQKPCIFLRRNNRKRNARDPDYRGTWRDDTGEYWLSGWLNGDLEQDGYIRAVQGDRRDPDYNPRRDTHQRTVFGEQTPADGTSTRLPNGTAPSFMPEDKPDLSKIGDFGALNRWYEERGRKCPAEVYEEFVKVRRPWEATL